MTGFLNLNRRALDAGGLPAASGRRPRSGRALVTGVCAALVAGLAPAVPAAAGPGGPLVGREVQSLDGSGNNLAHPDWGRVGTAYTRLAPARYADGIGEPVAGPDPRRVSNRVFNDTGQKLFSERGMSQWVAAWGQFLDHTFGLRAGDGGELTIPFDPTDPLEDFHSDLPFVPFERSGAAPGTGVTTPREQPNTVSSYLDAWTVYGGTSERLEWLREGPVDGDLGNNGARLLLPDGQLPRRDSRGDPASAPPIDDPGGLQVRGVVAGDIRASENVALSAIHTLFAREHNRIVGRLPGWLTEEQKFQIARRVVIATQQYITYQQFLPTLGVDPAPYAGYRPGVDAGLGNEFATVGFRAHSMLTGDLTVETEAGRYTAAQLDALRTRGIRVVVSADGRRVEITVPPAVVLFNPDLVGGLHLGPVLQGLGLRPQARNDEQISDVVRSVQRQNPPGCVPPAPGCLTAVFDISAIDVARGADHGMPGYNQLREAYGLAPKASFRAVTGEASEAFPADPRLTPADEINDPDCLDFVRLYDAAGREIALGSERAGTSAVAGVRRTPLAARLKAIHGDVADLDAFTGMMAEPHVPGAEFGELQLAIWKRQFETLRDGDRFFYLNDPGLTQIRQRFGIDYRHTLTDLISLNTDVPRRDLAPNVFLAPRR